MEKYNETDRRRTNRQRASRGSALLRPPLVAPSRQVVQGDPVKIRHPDQGGQLGFLLTVFIPLIGAEGHIQRLCRIFLQQILGLFQFLQPR